MSFCFVIYLYVLSVQYYNDSAEALKTTDELALKEFYRHKNDNWLESFNGETYTETNKKRKIYV